MTHKKFNSDHKIYKQVTQVSESQEQHKEMT